MKLILFCITLVLGANAALAGDLKWDARVLDIQAEQGQKKVVGEFRFTNTSPNLVEIRKVQTSCGCTTAELSKKVVAPGESGVLKAVFTVGGRKGLQKKAIVVQTGKGKESSDVLLMQVALPEKG